MTLLNQDLLMWLTEEKNAVDESAKESPWKALVYLHAKVKSPG